MLKAQSQQHILGPSNGYITCGRLYGLSSHVLRLRIINIVVLVRWRGLCEVALEFGTLHLSQFNSLEL